MILSLVQYYPVLLVITVWEITVHMKPVQFYVQHQYYPVEVELTKRVLVFVHLHKAVCNVSLVLLTHMEMDLQLPVSHVYMEVIQYLVPGRASGVQLANIGVPHNV